MKIKSMKNAFLSSLVTCILISPQVRAQSAENSIDSIKRQASTTLKLTADQKAEQMLANLNAMSSEERKNFLANAENNASQLALQIQNEEAKLFKARAKHSAYIATPFVMLISGITSAASGVTLAVTASVTVTDGFKFSAAEDAEMVLFNKRAGAVLLISGAITVASYYFLKSETTANNFTLNESEILNLSNQLAGLKKVVLDEQRVIAMMKSFYNFSNN